MDGSPFSILADYIRIGGSIMWPLIGGMLLIWYAIGVRWTILRRGTAEPLRALIGRIRSGERWHPRGIMDAAALRGVAVAMEDAAWLRHRLSDEFFDLQKEMRRFGSTVTVLVAMAPLLGLLGTVSGMIETFRSMASAAFFSQSGGIAAGISEALHATQMGLAVAVPGLVFGRVLDQRQDRLEQELEELKDLLCAEFREEESQ